MTWRLQILLTLTFMILSLSHGSKLRRTGSGTSSTKSDVENIRNLYSKINKRDVRNVTTVAMLMGTISTGEKLKENLEKMMNEVKNNLDSNSLSDNKQKIKKIEYTMNRDRKAFEILYRIVMTGVNRNSSNDSIATVEDEYDKTYQNKSNLSEMFDNLDLREYLQHLGTRVEKHLREMQQNTEKMSGYVLKFFENAMKDTKQENTKEPIQEKSSKKTKSDTKTSSINSNQVDTSNFFIPPPMYPFMYNPYNNWPFSQFGNPTKTNKRRQDQKQNNNIEELDDDDDDDDEKENNDSGNKNEEQNEESESESESSEESSGPGGLAGLIASLSGGDMGSDVGALLGAVSGVVTNIFGPDGLDIESLISTGTGLIGGLLGGEENVGKVFSNYLGAALEGFSGGGGADNNGLFIGNFLGGTLAKLSADPDDEDAPIRPDIFLDNFAKGLNEGLGKSSDDREGEGHGSDSFSFIGKFISQAVAGIVNLIVQAILGSIGGSSEGSAGLSGSSSEISKGSSAGSSHHDPGLKPPPETGGYY